MCAGNARELIYVAMIDAHPKTNNMLKVTNSHRGSAALVIADLAEYLFKAHEFPAGMTPEQAQDFINTETISLLVNMLVDAVDDNCGYAVDVIAKLCHHGMLFVIDLIWIYQSEFLQPNSVRLSSIMMTPSDICEKCSK